jgi:hypothetical protein
MPDLNMGATFDQNWFSNSRTACRPREHYCISADVDGVPVGLVLAVSQPLVRKDLLFLTIMATPIETSFVKVYFS